MTEKAGPALRALVVGTGFGCRIQVPALRGAGFDVAGLVGSNPERTAERAAENGIAGHYTDLEQAIGETGADLVVISTPPHTHAPLTIRALEAGCHVLCEKPFARDAAEARAMLAAAEKAGKVHTIGNEFRYTPERSTVARAIAEGRIGEPYFASFVQYQSFVADFEDDFPDWWFRLEDGGGWLGTSASHVVDQIRSWLGEFESVSAGMTYGGFKRGPVEDSFSVRFRLENGLEGVMQQTACAFGSLVEMTRVAGSDGTISMDWSGARLANREGEAALAVPPDLALPPPPPLGDDPRQQRADWQAMAMVEIAPYTELCRTVRAAILGEPAPSPVPMATFADGVANMQVLDAIRISALNGGAMVRVKDI